MSDWGQGSEMSRSSSRRVAGGAGGGAAGGSSSGGGVGRSKSINQSIAERVLERVGTGVDGVAERISEMQEEEGPGEEDGGSGDDGDGGGGGGGGFGGGGLMDRFRRAGRAIKATVRMDFGTDLMRRIPPPPELGTVHAYIAIDRSKSSLYPTYKFYTQAEDSTMDRFVLAARQVGGP